MANLIRTGWSYADAVRGPVRQHKSAGLTPIPTKDEAFPPLVQTSPPEQLPLPATTAAEPIAPNGIHVVSLCQCHMSIFRVNYNFVNFRKREYVYFKLHDYNFRLVFVVVGCMRCGMTTSVKWQGFPPRPCRSYLV